MGIDRNLDIAAEHRATVDALLETYLPGTAAWAYGSRVAWTAREHSDLDLVVFATPEQSNQVGLLREAFEESDLPFRVDLFVWDAVPESFRKTIEREHVVLSAHQKTPSGRRTKPLRDLAELRLSSVDKKTVEGEFDVRLCNYTDVYYNDAIRASIPFMRATATESEIDKCRLLVNDVVITKDSEKHDDIGVPSLVKETMDDLVCGYHLAILRPRPWAHGPYLFYALSDRRAQHQFHAYANGITRFGLRKADIGLVDVPIPSLPEQRAIARVLGALDDRIELNRRMNETLGAMARALFKSWFVDFDPVRAKMEGRDTGLPREISDMFPDELADSEIGIAPAGWELRRLGELATMTKGCSYRSEDLVAAQTALVTLKSFHRGGGYRSDGLKPYRGAYRAEQVVTPGDIIVACTDVTQAADIIGRSAVVLPSSTYATLVASLDVLILRPSHERMKRSFLCYLTNSARFVAYTYAYTTGTTVLHLDKKSIPEFLFPLPPMELVRHFDDHVSSLLRRVAVDSPGSDVLPAIRDALLPHLVSGGLRLPAPFVSALAGKRTENSVANAELPSHR